MNVDAPANKRVSQNSYPLKKLRSLLLVFLGVSVWSSPVLGVSSSVQRISIHTIPYSEVSSLKPGQLTKDANNGIVSFFDSQNRLVQERYAYRNREQCSQRAVLSKPRVYLIDCPRPRGSRLEGFDSSGRSQWSYEIRGEQKVGQAEVFGASERGIVLSGLQVINPETGKVILKPPIKISFKPRLTITRTVLYVPSGRTFYYYDAEVSLFSKKGGLFQINPPYQEDERLLPLKWGLLGHASIDAMAMSRDNKYLFLGKRWDTRGAGWLEFAVFDLERKREVFRDRTEGSCVCHNLKITVGMKGRVAFSYDQTAVTKAVVYQVDDSPLKEKLP